MKPVMFKEHNRLLERPRDMTEDQWGALPVHSDGRYCISKWQMNWRDRVRALLFGSAWLYVWSGKTQPPVSVTIRRTVFEYPQRPRYYRAVWARAMAAMEARRGR